MHKASTGKLDWVTGDNLGLSMPCHGDALRDAGEVFLTRAFQAAGTLEADNRVARITRLEECAGGSTGKKFFLSLRYARPAPTLHTSLFVKFSRDFNDSIRDRARYQLEPEVRLAMLSRKPGFPIAVPTCYFADFHAGSGTGMLITERIPFSEGRLEPLYEKCLDYRLSEPLTYYHSIIKALARLAGAQQSGRLAEPIARDFPFDPASQPVSQPIRYNEEQLLLRVDRLAAFSKAYPQLMPPSLVTPTLIAELQTQVPRFLQHEQAIKNFLHSQPALVALAHWNANIDNAWFWRNASNELECGLLDWGGVGQMNLGLALWGALSAAETELWELQLNNLLTLFINELHGSGGSLLDKQTLKLHMMLGISMMCLAWLMDAPAMIQREIPDLAAITDRFDPRFEINETARTQLRMFSNFLWLWQQENFAGVLDTFLIQRKT